MRATYEKGNYNLAKIDEEEIKLLKRQKNCSHDKWITRCSKCKKILASDMQNNIQDSFGFVNSIYNHNQKIDIKELVIVNNTKELLASKQEILFCQDGSAEIRMKEDNVILEKGMLYLLSNVSYKIYPQKKARFLLIKII